MRATLPAFARVVALAFLHGCASGVRQEGNGNFSSSPAVKLRTIPDGAAPPWVSKEPEPRSGVVFFVGLSEKFAVQRDARDDAEKHARARVARYVGSRITERWDKLVTSHGLASDVVDPTTARRGIETMSSKSLVARFKIHEWYVEEWGLHSGQVEYYLAYGLGSIPAAEIDKAIDLAATQYHEARESIKKDLEDAQELLKEAVDDKINGFEDRADRRCRDAVVHLVRARSAAATADMSGKVGEIDQLLSQAQDLCAANPGEPDLGRAVERLAEAMGRGPVVVAVASATWRESSLSSPVATYLIPKVESELMRRSLPFRVIPHKVFMAHLRAMQLSLEAVQTDSTALRKLPTRPDGLLTITYESKPEGLSVALQVLKAGEGTGMGVTKAMLPLSELPPGLAIEPANKDVAESVLVSFARAAGARTGSSPDGHGEFRVKVWPDRGESAIYRQGERILFNVRVTADCFLYLLHAAADGNVKLLFPNTFQASNRLRGGQLFAIPWPGSHFKFTAKPPFGSEFVLAVATASPLSELEMAGATGAFRSLGTAESQLFHQATHGLESLPSSAKATSQCSLTIMPSTGPNVEIAPRPILNLAVLSLTAENVLATDATVVSDMLRTNLAKARTFRIIERSRVDRLLTEQALQQTGATDTDTAVKLGKLLNAQRLVLGSLGKVSDTIVLTVQVVDVESGEVVHGDSVRAPSVDILLDSIHEVTERLVNESR